MIVDCTDIKIAIPKQMDIQKETYSAYQNNHNSDKGDYLGSASFGSMWALKKSSRANRLGCQLSSRAIGMMTLSFVVQTTK
ncbi:hypothetical protein F7725_028792 [Dissostichus mawsoni]|uniref:Uncharacterized protein n=1 Tax=Dissostichus mawsoni TaxID=36200 RepID=A0A7J5XGS6_DISMA|nr:hypothetical protein F7725_028792 [Dissostichus mawsoni]